MQVRQLTHDLNRMSALHVAHELPCFRSRLFGACSLGRMLRPLRVVRMASPGLSFVDQDARSNLRMQLEVTQQSAASGKPEGNLRTQQDSQGSSAPGQAPQPSSEMKSVARAAYQGVPGAYSEQAALKACPGLELLPCPQFEIAFQALSQWLAERAVLPIENSLGGSIHTVYDLLLRYNLHIVGEVQIEVNHCLLALPGVDMNQVKRVMSHPQALAQVDGYLRRLPGVVREEADDTAGAAQLIAKNGWKDAAAVASKRAAELYSMNILDEGIQDMADNVTRFIVLSRDPLVITDPDSSRYKTSVVFSLRQGPGQLFKALSVFALRDIDLTKIESRPLRAAPLVQSALDKGMTDRRFNFLFYIDFIGNLADERCQNALRHLQEIAPFLRVLGSYPRDTSL